MSSLSCFWLQKWYIGSETSDWKLDNSNNHSSLSESVGFFLSEAFTAADPVWLGWWKINESYKEERTRYQELGITVGRRSPTWWTSVFHRILWVYHGWTSEENLAQYKVMIYQNRSLKNLKLLQKKLCVNNVTHLSSQIAWCLHYMMS